MMLIQHCQESYTFRINDISNSSRLYLNPLECTRSQFTVFFCFFFLFSYISPKCQIGNEQLRHNDGRRGYIFSFWIGLIKLGKSHQKLQLYTIKKHFLFYPVFLYIFCCCCCCCCVSPLPASTLFTLYCRLKRERKKKLNGKTHLDAVD